MKKYNERYIQRIEKHVRRILDDKAEFDDYTMFSLTIQNAVQAAANTFGFSTDEEKHRMAGFIHELAVSAIQNLKGFDITFEKRGNCKKEMEGVNENESD